MALTLAQAYAAIRAATKLVAAAYARTLTNNPSPGVVDALETEAANTAAALGASVVPSTSAVVDNAATVPVKNSTNTVTVNSTATVADGVLTQVNTSAFVALLSHGNNITLQNSAGTSKGTGVATITTGVISSCRPPASTAIVLNGEQITATVTGTYVNKFTATVANGVITGIVLS